VRAPLKPAELLGGHRWLYVLAAAGAAAATVGFFTGTRGEPVPHGFAEVPADDEVSRGVAPTYGELGESLRADARLRHAAALERMRGQHPSLMEEVELDEEAKLAALERRAERRAYNGAPPIIPHPIDQMETQQCASCHWEGMRVESRVANPMSHSMHTSCTQCHVVGDGPVPGATLAQVVSTESSFEGLAAPRAGERAWPGAPPVIPHSTQMRDRCSRIRSSHPWRQSCEQCHAPGATLDQRPTGLLGDPPAPWLAEGP